MKLLEEGVFPVRFLGFGFFWAWLFIAGLSPSPLFGSPLCVGGIPFELFELLMRCAMLAISLTLSCVIATDRGKYCFLALGAVAGIAVTPLLLWGGSEEAHSVAALLTAMTEVSLFLMWLSFFGAMRLGDTLTLLVISYGVGALLFLVALMGGERTLLGASIVFPLLSAAALVFSSRLISRRGGTALFDNESTEPLKDEALSEETSIRNVTKSIPALKMTLALVCYSLAFSLLAAMAFSSSFALPASYLAEPVCIVVLAGVYILYAQFAKDAAKPYVLYRAVAPSMGLGFALLAISGGRVHRGRGDGDDRLSSVRGTCPERLLQHCQGKRRVTLPNHGDRKARHFRGDARRLDRRLFLWERLRCCLGCFWHDYRIDHCNSRVY